MTAKTSPKDATLIVNKASCLAIGLAIVDQENQNYEGLADKYAILAEDISVLDEADLHSTMCALQDKATPTGWNRFMAGMRKPLGKLGLVWTSTRNKDSRKSPKPFRLESKTIVQARKLAEESREEAENDRLLAEAAERNASRKQEQDESITAKDLADSLMAEASRLGIGWADVRDCLTAAIAASRKTAAAATATKTTATKTAAAATATKTTAAATKTAAAAAATKTTAAAAATKTTAAAAATKTTAAAAAA